MKTKHEVENSRVYLMDCMEFMKDLPDGYFHLACVDPPYGLERFKANDGGNSKKIKSFGDKDKNWNNIKPLDEYWKELFRISEYQIVWGANNFDLPTSEYFIIWDKMQMMPSFAQCEQAWTNCRVPAKIYRKRSICPERIHPTQKPIALYQWIFKNYLPDGGKVFDSHLGSGSSRIAADKAGNIDFTGTEIDEDYFKASVDRFNKYKSQLTLF